MSEEQELERRHDREVREKLEEYVKYCGEQKEDLDRLLTRLGTGKEEGGAGLYQIIKIFVDVFTSMITQAQNQLKQANICMEFVRGFEVKYKQILAAIEELKALIEARLEEVLSRIEAVEGRLAEIEQERAEAKAVNKFFGLSASKIILVSQVIVAIGIIITAISYWVSKA